MTDAYSTIIAGTAGVKPNICQEILVATGGAAPTTGGLTYTKAACKTLPATITTATNTIHFPHYTVAVLPAGCVATVSLSCEFYLAPYTGEQTTPAVIGDLSAEWYKVAVWSLGTGGMTCKQVSGPIGN